MSSAEDLSEKGSDKEIEEEDASKEQDQEGEEEKDEADQNAEVISQKRVTFKDNQPDTIQQVYMEVNDISKGIDSFLTKLKKPAPNNYSNLNSQLRSQIYQQQQGPIYPNYSHQMQLEKSYQRDLLPQLQDNLDQYKKEQNKFFYTKQDMSQVRQIQNNQEKYASRNREFPSQVINDKSYSQMNTSKYNYYGQYRYQADKFGLTSQNNLRNSHSQQPPNASYYQSIQQYPLSKRQTINDISSYQNPLQRNVENSQNLQNVSSYNFNRNIEDINQQMGQLSQSIYQDTLTNKQNPSQQIPSYYNSVSQPQQTLQKRSEYDSINQRQDHSNYLSNNKMKQKEEYGEYSNKSSNQNSFNFSKSQNVRDLYKYRPKRDYQKLYKIVIEESELYGEIQQTFIPNRTSKIKQTLCININKKYLKKGVLRSNY